MAEFTNERENENIQLNEGEELASFNEPQSIEVTQEAPVEKAPVEAQEEVPDKYRGKDIKDIIRMHQEAEKLLGKHSQEVGELRKTVDNFIQSQFANNNSKSQEPEVDFDEDAYYTNPKEAVVKTIDNHPAVKEAKQAAMRLKQQEAIASLRNAHPDYESILANDSFQEWVGKSNVRKNLMERAHYQFDTEAANEVFSLWKERKEYIDNAVKVNKEATRNQVKQASVGSVSGSAEPKSRKIYRRQDIINLMETNPRRYEALQDEIMRAYAENRVR